MVKIPPPLTYRVQNAEEQRCAGADLVKLEMRVERDVLMQRVLLHLGDEVAGHSQEEQAKQSRIR
jgi:hypothetical protein